KIKANSHWPGQFLFYFPPRSREPKNYLTPSLAPPRPPFLLSLSIAAPTRSLVHSASAQGALPETRAVPATAPAKLPAPAAQPEVPILRRKESPCRRSQSSVSRF